MTSSHIPAADDELFDFMKKRLFPAVVGDVMDTLGIVHQFLPPEVTPLAQEMQVAGRAMPVLEADCTGTTVSAESRKAPFGLMFKALDDLKKGEVYLCTGGGLRYALWGELMTTRALQLGAAAAVLDGYARDTKGILRLGFPVFCRGRYSQDQAVRGRVIDYRCPVELSNGVRVEPGDIVFGDSDGVVVVPRQRVTEILQAALEKVMGENKVRSAIEGGMSAVEAFERFGIM
jgi:4-hydroxy-4-methyl-2-oxoglutarate aldolase